MSISNRKKIRGWKRQIKKIDKWFETYRQTDVNRFNQRFEDYTKIRIDPWNRLCERVPPQWYFRLIIKKLIQIYDEWNEEYKKNGSPYDLQIWLNDPNNIRSQVVCAKVNNIGERRVNYYRKSNDSNKFPYKKWRSNGYDLDKFEWELFDDENFEFKNLFGLDDEDISNLYKQGYKEEKTIINGKEENLFSKKVGHVWIGRLK